MLKKSLLEHRASRVVAAFHVKYAFYLKPDRYRPVIGKEFRRFFYNFAGCVHNAVSETKRTCLNPPNLRLLYCPKKATVFTGNLFMDAAQIEQFRMDVYLVAERLITGDKLEYFVSVFDALVERARSMTESVTSNWCLELDADRKPIPGILHKIQGVCLEEPRILDLARDPAIVQIAEALIGPDLDVFGTKFFPKLPRVGNSTHWHQDNYYFSTHSDRVLSCGIYLQAADRENGCLRIVPGSHLGEIADHERDLDTYGSWARVDESQAVDLEVPAGTVVLFSANLLHGARDNLTDRSRYSTAWHYLPGGFNDLKYKRGEYKDRHPVSPHPAAL